MASDFIKEKQVELKNKLKDMQEEWLEEQKNMKENIEREKLNKAENKAEDIAEERELQLSLIKNKYQENKQQIIDEIFQNIISSL